MIDNRPATRRPGWCERRLDRGIGAHDHRRVCAATVTASTSSADHAPGWIPPPHCSIVVSQ
jgi:hypothetical protein